MCFNADMVQALFCRTKHLQARNSDHSVILVSRVYKMLHILRDCCLYRTRHPKVQNGKGQ